MKSRILAVVLLSVTVSLAQTSSQPKISSDQPQTQTPQTEVKENCPCCDKMSAAKGTNAKDMAMCCAHHHDGSADSPMSCCQGKDGKDGMSCTKGDAACCGNMANGKERMGCCSQSIKGTDQAQMSCCGNQADGMAHGHCGMMSHHDDDEMER